MRCLRLKNHEFLIFFPWVQLYRLENAKSDAWDFTEFRNQVHYTNFLRVKVIDSSWRTFYTRFGSGRPPVSLEITTIGSLPRETNGHHTKNLTEKGVGYSSNTFSGSFYADYCCRKDNSCFYYEKVHRTIRNAIVSNLLKCSM